MKNEKNKFINSDTENSEFSFDHLRKIVTDLEQELSLAPSESPLVLTLKKETKLIKKMIEGEKCSIQEIENSFRNFKDNFNKLSETIEGKILRDSVYITEIAKILGLP